MIIRFTFPGSVKYLSERRIRMKLNLKRSILTAAGIFLSLTQISAKDTSPKKDSLYPDFTVEVNLTPDAEKKLKQTKRTVTVNFEFGTDLGPDSTNTVQASREIKGHKGGKFSTKELKLTGKQLKKLGNNYEVNISAHSTHKGKNSLNLLNCESEGQPHVQSSIKDVLNKNIVLSCSLLK